MSVERRPPELTPEKYAYVAARVAVHTDLPRAEVLRLFGFTEPEWERVVADWNRKIVDEIRTRAGTAIPVADRYPLSTAYAVAYAKAVREARREQSGEPGEREEEATLRISPGTPSDQPFSVLTASNHAAAAAQKAKP